jgi:hypothetical protein
MVRDMATLTVSERPVSQWPAIGGIERHRDKALSLLLVSIPPVTVALGLMKCRKPPSQFKSSGYCPGFHPSSIFSSSSTSAIDRDCLVLDGECKTKSVTVLKNEMNSDWRLSLPTATLTTPGPGTAPAIPLHTR